MADLPLSMSGLSAFEVATQMAKNAGRIITRYFQRHKEVRHKGRGNVVTHVDLLAEKSIFDSLGREYPSHGILSEETPGVQGDSGYVWIVDPLDGTRNYASSVPLFCVNIALTYQDDVLLGLTYDPVRRELFWAEKGKGAFLNRRRIHPSTKPDLQSSLIGFDMGYHDDKARGALKLVTAIWPGMQSIRIMGSAALGIAYAACGRLDLYFHHYLFPWDLASGVLLVREAGGVITDREGGPISLKSPGVIASNKEVWGEFTQRMDG